MGKALGESLLLAVEEYLGFCSTAGWEEGIPDGDSKGPEVGRSPGVGSPAQLFLPPASPPTIMVPPVWVRRGFSTFLCTRKLGRKMTGGISVMVATAKDHCGQRHRPLGSHCHAQSSETEIGNQITSNASFKVPWVSSRSNAVPLIRNESPPPIWPPPSPGSVRASVHTTWS